MSGLDPHSPTTAGPEPVTPQAADAQAPVPPVVEPAPTATPPFEQPAGSALAGGPTAPVDPNPERLVGAAFAGGLVAALVLKGMARRKHS